MYSLTGVSKAYGASLAMDTVSASLGDSGLTAILGPSGSGKTTLLRLLAFLERPDAGTVELALDGKRLSSDDDVRPWPTVTCVFQKQFLWPHLTLRDNIVLPLRHLHREARNELLRNVVDLFAMERFVDRFPNQVSGGEAQRAALARAFALQPRVILLDEAHSHLDARQQRVLDSHLVALRQRGIRLVIVTHEIGFARRHADEVLVLESGRLTDFGPPSILAMPSSSFLREINDADHAG